MTVTRYPTLGYVSPTVLRNKMTGIVMERWNNQMIAATSSPFTIQKSTDGGETWVEKHSEAHPNRNARLNFEDSRGYLFLGTALTSNNATILRSIDDGETWETVLTCDSDSAWYMIERDNGDLYLNEYNSSNTVKFAYNVWKSDDDGATWTKFYTHPPGPDPSNLTNRTMRHFHMLCRDSDDQMYITLGHGLDAGAYKLNDNGTLGDNIGDYPTGDGASKGGGLTGFAQADNGDMFFTPDNYPSCIYKYVPGATDIDDKLVNVYDIEEQFGSDRNSFMLGMSKGRYGVLYAVGNGTIANRPFLLMSGDDGVTWVYVNFTDEKVRPTFISISQSSTPRIHIDQGINRPFVTLPDYTKAQVLNFQ